MSIVDKIMVLTRQLYPTGRAFKMPFESFFEKLHQGLTESEARFHNDARSTLDSSLPDNVNFDEQDATQWERRLGLISNPLVPLDDRKLAIKRKMNHPGTIKARQHFLYLQNQLQAAGFDVYVYENLFNDGGGWYTKTPDEFSLDPYPANDNEYGQFEYGDFEYGSQPSNKIANSLDASVDDLFFVTNLRPTFFIGGTPAGAWAHVDAEREKEFRQLILKIKPVQKVGFLLVDFY